MITINLIRRNNLDDLREIVQGLEKEPEQSRRISKKRLIDVLNYLNFQNSTILINLQHVQYSNVISLRAYPQPCVGDTLHCLWAEKTGPANMQTSYRFQNFLIDRDLRVLVVQAEMLKITPEGISFTLPEHCEAIRLRKVRRYACQGISVELIQNGMVFPGVLQDFSTMWFRVLVTAEPPQTFQWINPDSPVYVTFTHGSEVIYSGECTIIRQTQEKRERTFVLEYTRSYIQRFKPDRFKNAGYVLTPQPSIVFNHPLTGKTTSLELEELSSSWFTVVEYHDNSTLFPGLVIPELNLEITPDFSIKCKAQVISEAIYESDEKKTVNWRIVVLDMDVQEQIKLSSLLERVTDRKSYVCGKVDLDALFSFFFTAGFVYPDKYVSMQPHKEQFKETYEKLYIESPAIARHFIHQDKGIIQGHVSMLRFYENTWIVHHHAAVGSNAAGIAVLNQIGRYINDYRCLYSSHMDFLICYYQPNNRFPNRVFGGFNRSLDDLKGCSIDPFACLNFHFKGHIEPPDTNNRWKLGVTQPEDLLEVKSFYEYISGGLMINALDMEPDMVGTDSLNREYKRLGFKRERLLFSLKKEGELKAVIMATISDTGLNMSSLTNCLHVLVMGHEDLPFDELSCQLSQLSQYYEEDEIPVLLYPLSYAENRSIPYKKVYNLWTLNTRYMEDYLEYMHNLVHRQ